MFCISACLAGARCKRRVESRIKRVNLTPVVFMIGLHRYQRALIEQVTKVETVVDEEENAKKVAETQPKKSKRKPKNKARETQMIQSI